MQSVHTENLGPIWHEIDGGLWHTTHPDRFLGIMNCGAILPNPKGISDEERLSAPRGSETYSCVRRIGGVSLFDYSDFDPDECVRKCPWNNWHDFIPFWGEWGGAIWIEIDRRVIAENYVEPAQLYRDCYGAGNFGIMPRTEAAYLGALPCAAFKRALFAYPPKEFCELDIRNFDPAAYRAKLEAWRQNGPPIAL